ncbi:MAG: (deoxy)nucleoside triphosphate pyrophosphohydrolase [Bauldia sp.]
MSDILLVVCGALVDADGRVLICQRPEGKTLSGLWEFPGGKVERDETPEAALVRELREELGIETGARCLSPLSFASHDYGDFHLLMPLYLCRKWEGIPMPQEGQAVKWVWPKNLADYPMPPADKPLLAALTDLL